MVKSLIRKLQIQRLLWKGKTNIKKLAFDQDQEGGGGGGGAKTKL